MADNTYVIASIAVMAAVTLIIRALPFVLFSKRDTPALITYLGKYLPYAIMGMLVVYCLKDMSFSSRPWALPEIISIAVVVLFHIWKRNTLLSIASGTVCYMVLLNLL